VFLVNGSHSVTFVMFMLPLFENSTGSSDESTMWGKKTAPIIILLITFFKSRTLLIHFGTHVL